MWIVKAYTRPLEIPDDLVEDLDTWFTLPDQYKAWHHWKLSIKMIVFINRFIHKSYRNKKINFEQTFQLKETYCILMETVYYKFKMLSFDIQHSRFISPSYYIAREN